MYLFRQEYSFIKTVFSFHEYSFQIDCISFSLFSNNESNKMLRLTRQRHIYFRSTLSSTFTCIGSKSSEHHLSTFIVRLHQPIFVDRYFARSISLLNRFRQHQRGIMIIKIENFIAKRYSLWLTFFSSKSMESRIAHSTICCWWKWRLWFSTKINTIEIVFAKNSLLSNFVYLILEIEKLIVSAMIKVRRRRRSRSQMMLIRMRKKKATMKRNDISRYFAVSDICYLRT